MKNKEIEIAAIEIIRKILKADISRLLPVQQNVLEEVLCNGKSFSELKDIVNLTTSRQKILFDDAVSYVIDHIDRMNETQKTQRELEKELIELRHWKKLLEANLEKREEKDIDPELKKKLTQSVQLVEFSNRVKQNLSKEKIRTIGDIINYQRLELLRLRNFGQKSITEIENYFEKHGLWWDMVI
ncbi:DNA-directed RNA polymerase subunit alpha C-terminal domain-containing protein [Flavobacterium filum]|uniref:DNA-directed RNA polymerase subunit alpha C-terminal domain-containing protein n=1 Tax=Flavobacterium filum TaxID=370974 RepID=UPI0023F1F815|nr:DNA-directed RNA polymerase subunit alpha C-terminal domain-containing protein [Flavobacterium filum]